MVPRADVFITNFPPAVRRRLGIAYRNLAPLNERLVYASFTGYGENGQEANKPGFDSNAWWARSGMMDLVRPDHAGPPARSLPAWAIIPPHSPCSARSSVRSTGANEPARAPMSALR